MITVLVVDDEALVRSGLRMILDSAADIEVVGEARDGAEALTLARELHPDVVLLDIRMPGVDGLTAATRLAEVPNPPAVLVLTTFDLDRYVHRALRAGATGFLLKDTPPRELIDAVRIVHRGDALLAPSITKRLLETFATAADPDPGAAERLAALTDLERRVLTALARGLSNADIGRLHGMREAAVKAHVSRILRKLGLDNRVQAAILAHDAGWR